MKNKEFRPKADQPMVGRNKNESGTIVLIAVMIMATLLTAALGTGTLVINIVNQSASIDYSISAFYAAEAGIEKNLYRIRKDDYIPIVKKYGDSLIIDNIQYYDEAGEVDEYDKDKDDYLAIWDQTTLDADAKLIAHYDLSAINGKDQIVFDLAANQEYEVDFYAKDLSAALFLLSNDQPLMQLRLNGNKNVASDVSIRITIITYSQGAINIPDTKVETITMGGTPGSPLPFNEIVSDFAAGYMHKIKFKAFGGSLENLHLTAEDAWINGSTAVMPGTYVLTSTGSYPYGGARQATQILTVEMPILEPAYGLYNYVIFSEGPIDKSVNW